MRRIWKLMVAVLFLCAVTLTTFTSCQSREEDDLMMVSKSSSVQKSKRITPSEAIEMAKIAVGGKTRALPFSTPEMEVVKAKNATRSASVNDTVAYIINFADDNGFAVISASRTVYPVLAYSTHGRFDSSNEIAQENFIDSLEEYTSLSDEVCDFDIENDFVECEVIYPKVLMSIGQGSPWNKYVEEEYPGSPAGCGAVAAVLLMCNSKSKLTYHGVEYPFYYIVKALHKHDNPYLSNSSSNAAQKIVGGRPGGNSSPYDYTYEQAVDSVARLLYLAGKDMGMNYGENSSSVDSEAPLKLLKSLNYQNVTGYLFYDEEDVFSYVEKDYLIYVTGQNLSTKKGHAWIIDGARSCVNDQEENHPRTIFFHCDWGWSGYCNGYYNGSVFETEAASYKCKYYSGVKRDSDAYKAPSL